MFKILFKGLLMFNSWFAAHIRPCLIDKLGNAVVM